MQQREYLIYDGNPPVSHYDDFLTDDPDDFFVTDPIKADPATIDPMP